MDASLDEECWEYLDPESVTRGPFSSARMAVWYEHQMLPEDLCVRHMRTMAFIPIRELFHPPLLPFRSRPRPQPAPVAAKCSCHWQYCDTRGQLQGPFTSAQMSLWYEHCMLPKSLQLRRTTDMGFATIADYFPKPLVPFQSPPAMPLVPSNKAQELGAAAAAALAASGAKAAKPAQAQQPAPAPAQPVARPQAATKIKAGPKAKAAARTEAAPRGGYPDAPEGADAGGGKAAGRGVGPVGGGGAAGRGQRGKAAAAKEQQQQQQQRLAAPEGLSPVVQRMFAAHEPLDGADPSDPMDQVLMLHLLSSGQGAAPALRARRLGPGAYELDGRRVTLRWAPGSRTELWVHEDDVGEGAAADDLPLRTYLRLAANVVASLGGSVSGAPAISRLPQELRLTFDSAGAADGPLSSMEGHQRLSSMHKACEEARLRQTAAEAYEQALGNTMRQLRSPLPVGPRTCMGAGRMRSGLHSTLPAAVCNVATPARSRLRA
mmetsp:Transcript_87330/g.271313  ORF Transcript_87330/g.271313 Transcript_87330/m.271313 type:complete len:490 (+) Transcript_87330:61-1530(+)